MSAFRLTSKQRNFAELVKQGEHPETAYQSTYDCENSSPATIKRAALKLLNHTGIKAYLDHYERVRQNAEATQLAAHTALDKAGVIAMALEDRALARANQQSGAAVSATRLVADLMGMIIDRKDVTFRKLEDLSDSELDSLLDRLEINDGIGEPAGTA